MESLAVAELRGIVEAAQQQIIIRITPRMVLSQWILKQDSKLWKYPDMFANPEGAAAPALAKKLQ